MAVIKGGLSMKKHKLLSFIAAASIAASALSAPASVFAVNEEKLYYPTWQEAYFTMLKLAYGDKENFDFTDEKFGSRFELYDVDCDGTPELFISKGSYHVSPCIVYTYRDGHITDSMEIGSYGEVFVPDSGHYLVYSDSHMGCNTKSYFELKDGKFVYRNSFSDNIDNAGHEEVYYEVDGKRVTETEYVQTKEQYDHFALIQHGRKEHQYIIEEQVAMGIYRFFFDHYALSSIASDTKDLEIPDEINGLPVTEINAFAINGENLRSVKFGKNISVVRDRALGDNRNLTSVMLNDGIKELHDHVFANCPLLDSINGPKYSKTYFCKDGMVFFEDNSKLKAYPSGRNSSDVIVPKYISTVLSSAFSSCNSIENITFSPNTKSIGKGALANCNGLNSVTILAPDAVIEDPEGFGDTFTISNGTVKGSGEYYYDGVIRGYKGSTAEAYAKKYAIKFEAVDYTPIDKTGDTNNDGTVNSIDASSMLSEYARTATGKDSSFNIVQFYAADIDNNGKIDSVDASRVLSYYSFLSTHDDDITIEEFFNMAQ